MKIKHWKDVPAQAVPGQEGATIRWVLNDVDGAPHFALRVIELQPGASSPHHSHWWEHEIFVLQGTGMVVSPAGETPIRPGTTILVEGDDVHQLRNTGDEVLRFICLIPFPWLEGLAAKYASEA